MIIDILNSFLITDITKSFKDIMFIIHLLMFIMLMISPFYVMIRVYQSWYIYMTVIRKVRVLLFVEDRTCMAMGQST